MDGVPSGGRIVVAVADGAEHSLEIDAERRVVLHDHDASEQVLAALDVPTCRCFEVVAALRLAQTDPALRRQLRTSRWRPSAEQEAAKRAEHLGMQTAIHQLPRVTPIWPGNPTLVTHTDEDRARYRVEVDQRTARHLAFLLLCGVLPVEGRADLFAGDVDGEAAIDGLAALGLAPFFDPDGRLVSIPAKPAKRDAVVALLAEDFELGRDYAEAEVNEVIKRRHPDSATLRRAMVDLGLMTRADGTYRRVSASG